MIHLLDIYIYIDIYFFQKNEINYTKSIEANNVLKIIRYKFKNISSIFHEMRQIRECDLERMDYLEKEIEKLVRKLSEDEEQMEELCERLAEKSEEIGRLKGSNLVGPHRVNKQ